VSVTTVVLDQPLAPTAAAVLTTYHKSEGTRNRILIDDEWVPADNSTEFSLWAVPQSF